MLTRILRLIGRQREQYRIDNILRCATPSGSIEKWHGAQEIIDHCKYLDTTLASPHTKVVVPMGGAALKRVLGLAGNKDVRVQDFHGTVQRDPSDSFWVVPTYHPSHIQRGATDLIGVAAFDLSRAQELIDGSYVEDTERLILDPPVDWFETWANEYIAAATQDPYAYPMAVDIETPEGTLSKGEKLTAAADDSYKLLRINFSCDPEEGVTVPADPAYMRIVQKILAINALRYLWFKGYDEPRLIANNAMLNTMASHLMNVDLMWAFKALQPALPMGLGHASPFYVRGPAWKHLSGSQPAKYGATDGRRTRKIGDGILADLQSEGREQVFWRHQHRFHAYVLQPATDVGLAIDRARLATFKAKLDLAAAKYLLEVQAGVPSECQPETPKLGLTRPPAPNALHPKATEFKKDGTAKKEAPDPIKAEVYKLASVIEKLVLREVGVCKACGATEVAKTHRCDDSRSSFWESSEGVLAEPIVLKQIVSVRRWFWVEPFNPDSPPQLLALGKLLKLDPGKDKKSGNDSVNRECLQRWKNETAKKYPAVSASIDASLNYKAVAKVRSTYVVGIETRLDDNDRVHGTFGFKPQTMRLNGTAPNLTNVVADKGGTESLAAGFRHCVVARGRWVEAGSEYADG